MIQLTLTEEQAQLVGMACEFFARVRMGQFGEIPFRCAEKHCPKDPEATQRAWLELRKHIYPDLCGVGHSYGIGKFDDADRAFDVYQVIRYAMGGQPPFSYHELPKCEKVVAHAPGVDSVQVVRCKDCIHRVIGTWAKCTGRKPDDFCSDGVNRFHD